MLNFVKHFFCIYWDDHVIFILYSVNVLFHINWLSHVESSLHPRDKSYLVMVYDPFNVLYFVEDFCINVHQGYWSVVFLSEKVVFVWFWYQSNDNLIEQVGKYSFLFDFLEKIALNVGWNSVFKPSRPGIFCWKEINYSYNLFRAIQLIFLLEWTLVVCVFQGICPFSVNLFIYYQIFIIFSYYSLIYWHL